MPDEKLTIKVYLDTCILSNLRTDKIKEEQLNSLDKICNYENIVFVTSDKMLEEFLKTTEDRIRITLKILYKLRQLYHRSTYGKILNSFKEL